MYLNGRGTKVGIVIQLDLTKEEVKIESTN